MIKRVNIVIYLVLFCCSRFPKFKPYFNKGSSEEHNLEMKLSLLLIEASIKNDIEKVQEALNKGANINYKDSKGITALEYAIFNNNRSIVKMLIKRGANFRNILPVLITKEKKNNFLDKDFIKFLLKFNFDIDAQNKNGDTALILATKYNNLKLLNLLLMIKIH